MRWKLTVSALAIAGVAMIGAVFALKGGVPGSAEDAAVHRGGSGADQGAAAQRPDGRRRERRRRFSPQGNAKPAPVKVVNSEEQPVDLNAQAPVEQPASDGRSACSADQAKPPAGSDPTALAATGNTPLVAPPGATAPSMPSEFPVRNRSAQSR